jgi:hypothetical protein
MFWTKFSGERDYSIEWEQLSRFLPEDGNLVSEMLF